MTWRKERRLDHARWELLYEDSRASLYRGAALIVGESEAEEVVQEAFERAMRERDFFDRVREPRGWLRTTCTRLAISRLRRRAVWDRVRSALRPAPVEPQSDRLDIRAALARIPAHQRAAVVLRYYLDADYREIASALGISQTSVGPILTRARQRLRQELR